MVSPEVLSDCRFHGLKRQFDSYGQVCTEFLYFFFLSPFCVYEYSSVLILFSSFFVDRMDEDYSHRLKQMTKKIQGVFGSSVLIQQQLILKYLCFTY